MKKIRYLFVTLTTFLLSLNVVSAACSTTEMNKLNTLAMQIKASYEAVEEEVPKPDDVDFPEGLSLEEMENYVYKEKHFDIHITNITKELYVEVTDSYSGETKKYTYDDTKDGVLTIKQTQLHTMNKYTIVVYTSNETECPGTKLYTHYLTTPRYNSYSESELCKGITEFYLCHEYTAVSSVSFDDFVRLATNYKNGTVDEDGKEITKPKEEEKGFFEKNRTAIIITIVIVVAAGGLATVIIVKKQRSRIV